MSDLTKQLREFAVHYQPRECGNTHPNKLAIKAAAEIERLRSIADRVGAWQTADGVWVLSGDAVYLHNGYHLVSRRARSVPVNMRECYWSTKSAAEAKEAGLGTRD